MLFICFYRDIPEFTRSIGLYSREFIERQKCPFMQYENSAYCFLPAETEQLMMLVPTSFGAVI